MWKYQNTDELYHYGVLGMKWGRRKAMPMSSTMANYKKAKAAKKIANKAYNKSFNKAYNYSSYHPISQNFGKHKKESDSRWKQATDKLNDYNKAKSNYVKAKNERKNVLNKAYTKVKEQSSFGDKLIYNNATRRKAAKYMADNNMSLKDARKKANKEAARNTAIILAGIGGYMIHDMRKYR